MIILFNVEVFKETFASDTKPTMDQFGASVLSCCISSHSGQGAVQGIVMFSPIYVGLCDVAHSFTSHC